MTSFNQTGDEFLDTLTGHDELAIIQHFGETIAEMVGNQSMFRRALIFVVKRREGMNDDDAREAALKMPLGEVMPFFPAESVEDVESGKDVEPEPDEQPTSSLASVS